MSKTPFEQSEHPAEPLPPDEGIAEAADQEASGAEFIEEDSSDLQAELEAANQRVLRTQAELENYRKRVRREMDEDRRYAAMPLLRDLLPVVENINRAIAAAEQTNESAGLLEGFRMVADQLTSELEGHQCKKIDAEGSTFDPNLHEAISQQPSNDHPENTVLHVVQVGYTLHDRVVRPSQVVVSKLPPPQ